MNKYYIYICSSFLILIYLLIVICLFIYIYIHVFNIIYIYTYIYIERERESRLQSEFLTVVYIFKKFGIPSFDTGSACATVLSPIQVHGIAATASKKNQPAWHQLGIPSDTVNGVQTYFWICCCFCCFQFALCVPFIFQYVTMFLSALCVQLICTIVARILWIVVQYGFYSLSLLGVPFSTCFPSRLQKCFPFHVSLQGDWGYHKATTKWLENACTCL